MRNLPVIRPPRPLPLAEDRIAVIASRYGGRPAEVPQEYYDFVTSDADSCCGASLVLTPYTHVAVRDGLWSDPLTWDSGTVPGDNASVNVGPNTVVYDVDSGEIIKNIRVAGTGRLKWATYKDTRLLVDTIMCHGILTMGEAGDAISESATFGKPRAEVVFHQLQTPGTTVRLGLNAMGPVRINGAEKAKRIFSDTDMLAGRDIFRLGGLNAARWRVGDKILFVATGNAGSSATDPQYTGPTQFFGPYQGAQGTRTRTLGYRRSQDEVRTIASIVGDTVKIDQPLQYDHVVTEDILPRGQHIKVRPVVCNLSCSILIRSADPSTLQTRGHTMFMYNDDVDCRFAEFRDIGRTDTDPSLVRPEGTLVYESNGGAVITNPNNVRGRYPIHLHWTGPFFGRKQVIVFGNSVWGTDLPIPGWAITHHASRAAIENNVVYNARGSGIVSELGNEIGQWDDNVVAWCRGDGFDLSWASRAEQWTNHNGHAGIAYENQSRNILQRGNIASSCHLGWMFMQQDTTQISRVPDKFSLRFYDPLTQGAGLFGGITTASRPLYGVEQAQIPDFDDNVSFGCGRHFGVAHRQFPDRTDNTPMISRRCHAINCGQVFHLINYTFNYSFYDALWTGVGSGSAVSQGNVSWAINFGNIKVKNYSIGFFQNGGGFNYNGYWIDVAFEGVATPFTDFTADWDITAWQAANPGKVFPQDHPLYNLMGPWVTDVAGSIPGVRWKGILRDWKNYTIADFPDPYPAAPRGPGGVEPLPGTPKPYFWLDPSSDTTVDFWNSTVNLKGIIVDNVGVRCWPDWLSSESFGPSTPNYGRPSRENEGAKAEDLVLRNGCFQDGGVWKTRCWFVDTDRLTGDYFQFYIDLTINGLDTGFLESNVVDPVKPELPLRREAIGPMKPIVIDTTPPVIVSPTTLTIDENSPLAVPLRATYGGTAWTLSGGPDQARFEIAMVSGFPTLRWAGDGVKDFGAPDDADLNNVYQATVRATNSFGYFSEQAVAITVQDKTIGVVSPFTDNFNRSNQNLEASPDWFRIGGTTGRAVILSNRLRLTSVSGDSRTTYLSPDTGSTNHYAQASFINGTGAGWLAVSVTDGNNFIGVRRNAGQAQLFKRVNNVDTSLGAWASSSGDVIRLEYQGGSAYVYINGVLTGTVAVSSPPPVTTRAGIVVGTADADFIDNYASGAL
jgi:hypothetical protein